MSPCPGSASPAPDAYNAVTDKAYLVPGSKSLSTVVVVSPLKVTSLVSPPDTGVYVIRYRCTLPGAGLQDNFSEDVVASETLKSLGRPRTTFDKKNFKMY